METSFDIFVLIDIEDYKQKNKEYLFFILIGFIYLSALMVFQYSKAFGVVWLETVGLFVSLLSLIVIALISLFLKTKEPVKVRKGQI